MKFLQTLSTLDSLQLTGGSRFQKALENSPENFKIQKLGEISPEAFEFQNPPEVANCPIWENFIFKLRFEISQAERELNSKSWERILNSPVDFEIQKLGEISKIQKALEISPEDFEIQKAGREFSS